MDLQWSPNFYASVGATAFRDNDTAGALLAWRGWSVGNRLTVRAKIADAYLLGGLRAELLKPATVREVTEALTTDRHFEQEGFQRLLIPAHS